jgi:MerR family transcriptional regulator, light-induced transcriptional regulator
MNLFSISQLSQFSGVKSHTIRIWEQRYNALKPERSEGNTRYYDDKQLRRLLNIVSLMDKGYKVSQLCPMSDEDLFLIIQGSEQVNSNETSEYYVSQLIAAGMSYDLGYFEHILSLSFSAYGFREAYKKVIHPVMNRIGLLWSSDVMPTVSEHFISNIFHQKLSVAIDSLALPDPNTETWLLLLPENEFHELPLLYASFLIRLSGRKVIYLGSNVPIKSLKPAVLETKPDKILMFLVHFDLPDQIQKDIDIINTYFTGDRIYLAGNQKLIKSINFPHNAEFLESVSDIERILGLNEYSQIKSIG